MEVFVLNNCFPNNCGYKLTKQLMKVKSAHFSESPVSLPVMSLLSHVVMFIIILENVLFSMSQTDVWI